MIEKAWRTKKVGWVVGGLIGGGGLDADFRLSEDEDDNGLGDLFDWNDSTRNDNSFESGFLYLEMHGGIVFSMLPWLHLGIDLSCPLFVSPKGFEDLYGFGVSSGSYYSINPGGRLRIVLGNIG